MHEITEKAFLNNELMASGQYPKLYFYRRLVQAKLYMDSNYQEKIDLMDIAGEAFFSKFHFIRSFKDIYHKTPHQYLIYLRIQRAMELLKTGVSVSDACYTVGFDSISSFSKLFKRTVGLNPSAYLAKQLATQRLITEAPLRFVPNCFAYQYGIGEETAISDK